MKTTPRTTGTKGFTLIELLVVIAVIGILASVVLASLNSARGKARDARRVADITELATAFQLYASDNNGAFPVMPAQSTYCIGVETGSTCWGNHAIQGSTLLKNVLAPYMPTLSSDPSPARGWGNKYMYMYSPTEYGIARSCTNNYISGHYILWRPEEQPTTDASCKGKGVLACCGMGAPCNDLGAYYCAYKLD